MQRSEFTEATQRWNVYYVSAEIQPSVTGRSRFAVKHDRDLSELGLDNNSPLNMSANACSHLGNYFNVLNHASTFTKLSVMPKEGFVAFVPCLDPESGFEPDFGPDLYSGRGRDRSDSGLE